MALRSFKLSVYPHKRPAEIEPPGADAFYSAVGRVLVYWGRFEWHFDMILATIRKLPECSLVPQRRGVPVPKTFSGKLELWERVFRRLPSLSDYRDHAEGVRLRAKETAERRNTLVHSTWQGFLSDDPLMMRLILLKRKGPKLIATLNDLTLSDVRALASQCHGLSVDLYPIHELLGKLQRHSRNE